MPGYPASKMTVIGGPIVLTSAILTMVALVLMLTLASPARADTFAVDTTDDLPAARNCTPAPDDCSLRGAFIAANDAAGADEITVPAGEHALTIAGGGEDGSATGDLDVIDDVRIEGAGASRTVVSAGGEQGNDAPDLNDRVLHVLSDSDATIEDLTLSGGSNGDIRFGGGGILNEGALKLIDSSVSDNSAPFLGGGIFNRGPGILSLTSSTLRGNSAGSGGGIFTTSGGTTTMKDTTVNGNSAFEGGGMVNSGSTTVVEASTVSGNTSRGTGGGIYSDTDIDSPDEKTTIENSTISGNSADQQGGGFYSENGLTTIRATTISNNTAPQDQGAGLAGADDTRTVASSSIVSGNSSTDVDYVEGLPNTFRSNGHNVVGDGNATDAFSDPTDAINVSDPGLFPLGENGGPTKTHALRSDSPAIDAGSTDLDADQRGTQRPKDGDGDGTARDDAGSYERAPGNLRFVADAYAAGENVGVATITVLREDGTDGGVSVRYATSDGTAEAPTDYTARSGTLAFADGQRRRTFALPIEDDSVDEPGETVNLTLSDARGKATLGEPRDAVLFIQDDDERPSLTVSDDRVTEGDEGTTDATFVVRLSRASQKTIKVEYATQDGTASSPPDYAPGSGALTFAPGQTRKSVEVPVKGDALDEPEERFFLVLSDASNAAITDDRGVGTIVDDDESNECTIVGTNSSDSLIGTPTRDVICALGGDDSVLGLGGDDVVRGGLGDDTVQASNGADTLIGGQGKDLLTGGDGEDLVVGGEGKDLLSGQGGDDELDARDGSGGDTLNGGPGTDECHQDVGDGVKGCP